MLGLTLSSVLLAFSPSSAQAADDCDTTVVDLTNERVLTNDLTEVEAASLPLQDAGAVVRVRAFQQAPNGSLDKYLDSQVRTCDSWRGADGGRDPKLIVFMFSMDHKSAILYGSAWHVLDSRIDQIRDQDMGDNFRQGDFPGGIIAAEQAVYDRMTAPTGSTDSDNGGDSGSSASLSIPKWVWLGPLLLIALALLIGGVWFLAKSLRRSREANEAAKQRTLTAWGTLQEAIKPLNVKDVRRLYEIVSTDLDTADKNDLEERLGVADDACNKVFTDTLDFDSSRRYPTARYDEMTTEFENTTNAANEAVQLLKSLEDRCNKLYADIQNAPQTLAGLSPKLVDFRQRLTKLEQAGYKHDLTASLQKFEALLREAANQIEAKHHGQALDELREADTLSTEIDQKLKYLETIGEEQKAKIANLNERLESAKSSVSSGEQALAGELHDHYGASCWTDLEQTCDAAQKDLVVVRQALDAAAASSTMDAQQWEEAAQQLATATSRLASAEQFEGSVDGRSKDLANLARQLSGTIQTATAEVDSDIATVQGLRGEQSGNIQSLKRLRKRLNALQSEIDTSKPELLQIDQARESLLSEADSVLQQAQATHQAILDEERRRREEEEEERRRRRQQAAAAAAAAASYSSSSSSYSSPTDFGGGSSGGWSGSGGGSSGSW
jgi:uncharacterized membrane protein YgcG